MTMLEVCGLEPSIAMSTLKRRLHGDNFYFSLFKKFSKDLLVLLAHAKKYINAKKSMVEKQKEKGD